MRYSDPAISLQSNVVPERTPFVSFLDPPISRAEYRAEMTIAPGTSQTQEPLNSIRRIISGCGETENTISTSEIPLEEAPGLPGIFNASIWKTNEVPSKDSNSDINFDGAHRLGDRIGGFVNSGGTNFFIQNIAPGAEVPAHRSNTIDHIIILSGEIISTSPEKSEDFRLTAGDVLVRKANSHGWKNPGPGWVRWACFIVDAEPVVINGKTLPEGFSQTS